MQADPAMSGVGARLLLETVATIVSADRDHQHGEVMRKFEQLERQLQVNKVALDAIARRVAQIEARRCGASRASDQDDD